MASNLKNGLAAGGLLTLIGVGVAVAQTPAPPFSASGCATVVVARASTADLPRLAADAECYGRAARSASESQVLRLAKMRELLAQPTPTPPPAPAPTPAPTSGVFPPVSVVTHAPKNESSAALTAEREAYALLDTYRPRFAALGYRLKLDVMHTSTIAWGRWTWYGFSVDRRVDTSVLESGWEGTAAYTWFGPGTNNYPGNLDQAPTTLDHMLARAGWDKRPPIV